MLLGKSFLTIFVLCNLNAICHFYEMPMHSIVLDRDGYYHVHWGVQGDEIVFKVEVQAKGYVGFGLSKTGGMAGSDIFTGWVKNGVPYFQDRHGIGNSKPPIDDHEDWELLSSSENNTHTVLTFRRKLQTCDEQDMEIDESTIRLIYSYSNIDPSSPDGLFYHLGNRGSRSVMLLNPFSRKETCTENVSQWDIRSPNFTIPHHKSSMYWCKLFKGPELPQKNHIIKVEPLLQPGNEQYVHHIVLYECSSSSSGDIEALLDSEGHECYHPNMPDEMKQCEALLLGWAIGGEAVVFPDHVGIPLRESPPKYYLMEMHYDNPALYQGIRDESGLRISFTPNLRRYDAGTLMIGAAVTPRLVIPPALKRFTIAGHSHPKCFDPAMPQEDLKILGVLLHSHLLGRHLKARHFRGSEELPPLVDNKNYDFNYQEYVMFSEEIPFKKGDQITVECSYDSTQRTRTTFGGLYTHEEMCLAFVIYYPRIERFGSMSISTPPLILGLTGIQLDSSEFNLSKFYELMSRFDWDTVNTTVVESAMRYSPHEAFCITGEGHKNSVKDLISYPSKLKQFTKPDFCTDREQRR